MNVTETVKSLVSSKTQPLTPSGDAARAQEGLDAIQRMMHELEGQKTTITSLQTQLHERNRELANEHDERLRLQNERDAALRSLVKLEALFETIGRMTNTAKQIVEDPLDNGDSADAAKLISSLSATREEPSQ